MAVHVVGISGGRIWHTVRNPTSWDPWDDVLAGAGPLTSPLTDVACGLVGGVLHVCALTQDSLWHSIRFGRGNWQAWGNAGLLVFPNVLGATGVDCVGIGTALHVCVAGYRRPGSQLQTLPAIWHAERTSNSNPALDSWSTPAEITNRYLSIFDHACGSVSGNLHVLARCTDPAGNELLIHTIRFPGGALQPQGDQDVFGIYPADSATLKGTGPVAAAGIGNQLHVVVSNGVELFHTIRLDDTSWQTTFGPVRPAVDPAFGTSLTQPACASADGNLHVLSISNTPTSTTDPIWHTIRLSNPPSWRNPETATKGQFGDVLAAVPRGPGGSGPSAPFTFLASAGM